MLLDSDAEGNDAKATPNRIIRRPTRGRSLAMSQSLNSGRNSWKFWYSSLAVVGSPPVRPLILASSRASIEVGLDGGHHSCAAQSREIGRDRVIVLLD